MKPLLEAVREAVKQTTLDESLRIIMESLGVTDGQNAGMFFDGGEEYYQNLTENGEWAKLDEEEKSKVLREYIGFELKVDVIIWGE